MKSGISDETKQLRALAILNEAKSGGMLKKQIPFDTETQIKLANYVVEEARARKDKGENGPHITNILFTADVDWTNSLKEDEDDKKFNSYLKAELENGLPIPPEIKGDIPELPMDLTIISLKELRRLHGAFNACAARVGFLYAMEETAEAAAKMIANNYEEKYIATADRKDIGGKAKAMKLLQIEAAENYPQIKKWRSRERDHSIKANQYKRLLESYNQSCDRLSREFTMRQDESQ